MVDRFGNWVLAALTAVAVVPLSALEGASAQCSLAIGEPCAFAQDSARPAPDHGQDSVRPAPDHGQDSVRPAPDRGKLANRLDEIGPLMSRCLRLPPEELSRPGMQITVRLSFTRDGEILGEPRFTFTTPGVSPQIRAAYQRAVVDMLDRCTPLPITPELGGAIAGRPFVFPIVDRRKEKKA